VASWSLILAALVVGITICVAIGYIVFLQPNPESNVPDLPPSDAVVETPPPFLPDIQCVDDDVVCLRHIFAKKASTRAREADCSLRGEVTMFRTRMISPFGCTAGESQTSVWTWQLRERW
jgi:hypothetical protein